jgi:methylmalonyl-CoA/ethylmalonyl-CoA epimerase
MHVMSSPSQTSNSFDISCLGQVAIPVHDISRATAFYRDTLGLPLLFSAGNLAFFMAGTVRIMLTPPDREELNPPGGILYYKVADMDAAFATLVERGAEVMTKPAMIARMPDHELWLAGFRDSEGNIFELMCEKR